MVNNLDLALSAGTPVVGSKNDRSTFTFTPTSCSTNGACAMNNNTMAGSGMWYYSWYAATAGEGKSTDGNVDVDGSICPVGWRIPPNYSVQVSKSYGGLTDMYGLTSNGGEATNSNIRSFPISLTYSRCRYNGGDPDSGTHGYYQTSTAKTISGNSQQYILYVGQNNRIYPQYDGTAIRSYAYNVRCVAL